MRQSASDSEGAPPAALSRNAASRLARARREPSGRGPVALELDDLRLPHVVRDGRRQLVLVPRRREAK
eukprot:4531757-Lingulodinium_polyedra.AAC.1